MFQHVNLFIALDVTHTCTHYCRNLIFPVFVRILKRTIFHVHFMTCNQSLSMLANMGVVSQTLKDAINAFHCIDVLLKMEILVEKSNQCKMIVFFERTINK